jgi:hypothetical protein
MREALAARELGDRDWLEVSAQVLDALAHAHERGIVHRDVKPSNVLLAEGDAVDVRLLDFGLAQMAEFDTLTAIGDVPGTLTYLSPERLAGENATEAADVWGVGVMLWEALAGRHPFRSSSTEGTTRRIRAGAPPIETLRPDLPPRVRNALDRALALDPDKRPSATGLAAELRARAAAREPRRRATEAFAAPRAVERGRALAPAVNKLLPAASAALWTGWVTTTLPFYPSGWPLGLTVIAAALGLGRARFAFPFALAATVLPLANVSLGLAVVFVAVAAVWTAATWSDPRGNAVAVAGPLLAVVSGLALLPLVASLARHPLRRALQVFGAVLVAAIVAGLTRHHLPFDAGSPAIRLGIAQAKSPTAVARALVHAAGGQLGVVEVAAALAVAAAALPYLRGRGIAVAATTGGVLLATTALLAPAAPLAALAVAALAVAAVLAVAPAASRSS